jgi:hypothetical protein
MGVLRTFILLISIVLEVSGLLTAMVTGRGLFQSDKASSSIKPSYPPVLLPPLLSGCLGGIMSLPSRSSRGGGAVRDNFKRQRTSLGFCLTFQKLKNCTFLGGGRSGLKEYLVG